MAKAKAAATTTAPSAVKLEFDKLRKLKVQNKYVREAVRVSGRSVMEMLNDPFGGYPFLVQALLQPGAPSNEPISLDRASELIDTYMEKNKSIKGLTDGLILAFQGYLQIEIKKGDDDDEDEDGELGNEAGRGEPVPSND